MAGHRIEYLAPLSWRIDPIIARLWITRIGTSSFSIGYELGEPDRSTVYAIAATTLVLVDTAAGAPVAIPDSLRATLTQWVGEPVSFRD
jgi:acyl-CoA thioester hydrolase